ncbi:hypothetical protein BD408DRAFT_445523 [Parasitella parasitica]|nr:hypothetical protein BD408DRAFT_445523 [Parasitella parasitica]
MSDYSTQKFQNRVDKTQKHPTKELDSQTNSRSNSFLRSLKSSKQIKSSEIELEEGETISPSPSPRHPTIKAPEKNKSTSKRETTKEKERSPNRHASSRRREDSRRSSARQERKSSRHDSDNDSTSKRRSSPDKRKDRGYRSSRYHSRSRSTSLSRTPPSRKNRNRSEDAKPSRSESSRRRSPQTTSRSDKSNGSSNNNRNSDNDSHGNKRKSSSRDKHDTIEEPGSINRITTPHSSKLQPKDNKPKSISATAPDSETPEQQKLFIIMFSKLAHANKRRGDGQTEELFGMIDHFHALCDYILNFYYVDKSSSDKISFKQASMAWKSLFPFTNSLLAKLESRHHYDLYGLCARLISLVRYYIYKRMIDSTRLLLAKQLSEDGDESSSSRACIQVSEGLLREYEKAERWYRTSEKYLSYGTIATQFPQTFKRVCIEGDLSTGITLGGEAGVSVEPMFPFTPYSPLHHAAIVSKCMLSEYVCIKKLDYSPISQPEEYMK